MTGSVSVGNFFEGSDVCSLHFISHISNCMNLKHPFLFFAELHLILKFFEIVVVSEGDSKCILWILVLYDSCRCL